MTNRKSTQENIQRLSRQITEFNADLMKKSPLALLDIDLLRKYTIDLYDEVNQLRLVMKEPSMSLELKEGKEEKSRQDSLAEPVMSEKDESEGEKDLGKQELTASKLKELAKAETEVEAEAEVDALVETMVEDSEPLSSTGTEAGNENQEAETQNPEITLAAAEAKVEADAIKAALNIDEANDLAYKFSNTPINDLKKAISIAKKFEFINSLFGGNVEKYAYSIHHINNLNSGDEAFAYLHELREEWKWDDEDKNFVELANLIRRRYLG